MDSTPPPGMEDFVNDPDNSDQSAPPGLANFVAPELQQQKYGTLPQQLLTGAESAGSAATFGGSKGLERALGVNPEDILAREKENPKSAFAGSVAGILGQTAAMGGTNVLEQAGVKGAQALGLGAEGAGLASRLGAQAVKGAIEGAMFQGGNEVGKMLLSDPSQHLETAAADIGLSGLLGAGLGVGIGAAGEGAKGLWNATIGKRLGNSLEQASSEINGASSQIPSFSGQQQMVQQGIETLKPNISEIVDAADTLGIPRDKLTPGTLSGSALVQDMEGNLAKRPTIAGTSMADEHQEIYNNLQQNAQKTLQSATLKSDASVGKEIKQGLIDSLKEKYAPIQQSYKEIEPHLNSVEIAPELKSNAIDSINNNEYAKLLPDSAPGKLAAKLGDELNNIKDVNQLKTYRTLISDRLTGAIQSGDRESMSVLNSAKDALNGLREQSLQSAAESGVVPPDVFQKLQETDAQYAAHKADLQRLGIEGGFGKIKNLSDIAKKFDKIPDESIAGKVFDVNDINQMQHFKENFPKQFDLARRSYMKDVFDNSISRAQGKNGQFAVNQYLNQMRKLSPEAKQMLFGSSMENGISAKTVDAIEKMYQALPGNPNPSGTAAALSHASLFTPEGIGQNLSDTFKYGLLKAWPHLQAAAEQGGGGMAAELATLKAASSADKPVNPSAFKSMVDYIKSTIKGENLASKAASNIFEAGKTVLPSHLIPDDKQLDKLDKKIKDIQANNSQMLNNQSDLGHYLPDHESAMAQTSMNAVNYLNSLRPKVDKMNPLDEENEPSQVQKTAFKNALTIAEQPLTVLNDVKEGSVSPQDILSMKTMYPALYQRVSNKLYTNLIEHTNEGKTVPYNTRLGLSLFLGRPLDSTMTPQAIMANQPQNNNAMTSNDKQQVMKHQNAHGAHSMKNIGQLATIDQTPQQARIANKMKA